MSIAPKAITSLQNERVKAIRALEMRKARKETGLFVAEGTSILITARDHGFVPETLVYRAGSPPFGGMLILSGPRTRELRVDVFAGNRFFGSPSNRCGR